MKPTTLFGTLVLLSAWSSVGATEAAIYSIQKADNSVEQRIAAARSDDSWSQLLKPRLRKPMDIAAWANGGGGGGGFANARYGGGWGNGGGGWVNGGGWRNGSGSWGNGGGGVFRNW